MDILVQPAGQRRLRVSHRLPAEVDAQRVHPGLNPIGVSHFENQRTDQEQDQQAAGRSHADRAPRQCRYLAERQTAKPAD